MCPGVSISRIKGIYHRINYLNAPSWKTTHDENVDCVLQNDSIQVRI
jgi:hypothetical protein